MPLPGLTDSGDLPVSLHAATLDEVLELFGKGTAQRQTIGLRLRRIHQHALSTGFLMRFVVFGSFVSNKAAPNDVDVVMIMSDEFDSAALTGEARLLYDHQAAHAHFGASVFWLRRLAVLGDEATALAQWQVKRDGTRRGIVEIIPESP